MYMDELIYRLAAAIFKLLSFASISPFGYMLVCSIQVVKQRH